MPTMLPPGQDAPRLVLTNTYESCLIQGACVTDVKLIQQAGAHSPKLSL